MSSTNKRNKVKFNICNVHYAPLSQDNDGKYTYQVLPQLIELWGLNVQTDVQSKKNFARLTGK